MTGRGRERKGCPRARYACIREVRVAASAAQYADDDSRGVLSVKLSFRSRNPPRVASFGVRPLGSAG